MTTKKNKPVGGKTIEILKETNLKFNLNRALHSGKKKKKSYPQAYIEFSTQSSQEGTAGEVLGAEAESTECLLV